MTGAAPTPTPPAAPTPEDVRVWCERAGMRPDSPLRAALLATFEAAAAGAEREMASLARRVDLRTSVLLAAAGLLLLGGGYALGR